MAGPVLPTKGQDTPDQGAVRIRPSVERDNRYIYSGDTPPTVARYTVRPNRRAIRRSLSTFNLIAVLLGVGLAIVVYVNNVITMNRLSAEIGDLEKKLNDLQDRNAVLTAEVSRKSGWERIGTIAGEQLGLRHANEPPVPIAIDEDKLQELKEK